MNYQEGYGQNMYDGNIDINITNQNVNDNTTKEEIRIKYNLPDKQSCSRKKSRKNIDK